MWPHIVEGITPTRWDMAGFTVTLVGMAIIAFSRQRIAEAEPAFQLRKQGRARYVSLIATIQSRAREICGNQLCSVVLRGANRNGRPFAS
jgi:hypothetical protein